MHARFFTARASSNVNHPIFEGLQVDVEMHDVLAITSVTHFCRNTGSTDHLTYTFAIPEDAVILGITVTVGDKTFKGIVLPVKKPTLPDGAVEEVGMNGDSFFDNDNGMLRNINPGVYTTYLGKLPPYEKIRIAIRYSTFQRWQDDILCYHLPVNIAPYDNAATQADMHKRPKLQTSLITQEFFNFTMKICGELAEMPIVSPSHAINVDFTPEKRECHVCFAQQTGNLGRDLVVAIEHRNRDSASAVIVKDGSKHLIWLNCQPRTVLNDDLARHIYICRPIPIRFYY